MAALPGAIPGHRDRRAHAKTGGSSADGNKQARWIAAVEGDNRQAQWIAAVAGGNKQVRWIAAVEGGNRQLRGIAAVARIASATEAFPAAVLRAVGELSAAVAVATTEAAREPAVHEARPAWVLEVAVALGAADGGGSHDQGKSHEIK
jgi:hypothetical protein